MTDKNEILKLIERYEGKPKSEWDEAQVRTSLLNPFWRALGWEIDNPEQVEVEKRIHMTEHTKFADYAFMENKKTHFLVEAKSPAHNLIKDKDAIFQVKRYVYCTIETYLGILQDFEEFLPILVLNAPDIEKPHVGLLKSHYMKYTEYVEKWDELCELYSREAVLSGSLEKLLPQGKKIEKVTEPLDRKFFNDLRDWRKDIAKSIAKRNPDITDERINESVNDLLNRLLFLRIIEDRKIESRDILHQEWLRWQLEQRGSLWAYLLELFADLNPKYNGTLFQRRKDDPLATIIIDDKPLHELIKNLYYPSPYLFSLLPVEIIGNAYEKYLGSVIRTTPSRLVKLEEKPEVRKAGGVYYTPKYIVEYIVEQTVGRLLDGDTVGAIPRDCPDDAHTIKKGQTHLTEGQTQGSAPTRKPMKPKDVRKLKILDPACGSGSFLIGAYERLERYYLDYYRKHPKENKGYLVKTPEGDEKLSFKIKQQILIDNLHGVDIDEQAVNITKFSLYVKLMEDEDYMSQNVLIGQALLPDLKNNIKCGNSLVGWDILDMEILPDGAGRDDILKKINPFDWEDAFPQVFHVNKGACSLVQTQQYTGGFDAVIGNPPYIRIQTMKDTSLEQVDYFKKKYESAKKGNYDIYVVFVERALQLINEKGRTGYILPHKFFTSKYGEMLRTIISKGNHLSHVVHFGHQQVFQGATTYTCLMFLDRHKKEEFRFVKVHDIEEWQRKVISCGGRRLKSSVAKEVELGNGGLQSTAIEEGMIQLSSVTEKEWNFVIGPGAELFDKLSNMPVKLGDVAEIFVGLQTSADKVFIMDLVEERKNTIVLHSVSLDKDWVFEKDLFHPIVSGTDVNRYAELPERQFILFPYRIEAERGVLIPFREIKSKFPKTAKYLLENKKILEGREKGKFKGNKWFRFGRSQNIGIQDRVKICVPRLVEYLYAAYDIKGNHYLDNVDVGGITLKADYDKHNMKYILGLLNSKLLRWFFPYISEPYRGGWLSANRQFIEQLPIRTIDFTNPSDVAKHDRMVSLVTEMLSLHKRLAEARGVNKGACSLVQKNRQPVSRLQKTIRKQIEITDMKIDELVYELYGLTEDEIKIVEGEE